MKNGMLGQFPALSPFQLGQRKLHLSSTVGEGSLCSLEVTFFPSLAD